MTIEKWNGVLPTMFGGSVPQLVTEVKNYLPSTKATPMVLAPASNP